MQKECTNCGSNATRGLKENCWYTGWSMIVVGILLSATFILAIIGIPLIIVGICMLIVSRFITNKQWQCRNCKTIFK